ncbi:MAG: hypothetical protein HOP22_00695 [Nitrospiraceae bacterium]|nr:hypothetical protein [Nitrospiraceae bacterium]
MRQAAMDLKIFPLVPRPGPAARYEVTHFSPVALLAVKLNAPVHVEVNGYTGLLHLFEQQ